MITPEPPAGSEHYREGWRHGYEQAAIDRERSADAVRLVPDTGQARGELIDDPSTLNLGDRVEWDVLLPRGPYVATGVVTQQGTGVFIYEDNPPRWGVWTFEEATNLRRQKPTGDTVQAADVAALAYARSEVDKWLASTDPYCILPTRTEHIPALLARLDELEETR